MATLETHNGYPLWRYIPNLGAAILFVVLFGLATAAHMLEMFKRRTWFCIPFIIGGLFEVVGYVGRALAHDATGQLGPYVMQSVLLLLAPVLFAASLYMTLARLIQAVGGERYSIVRARWLTRIFVSGDCLSFLVQSSGAGLLVRAGQGKSGDSNPDLGQNIIIGGLILQIILFGIFCLAGVVFHLRFRKHASHDPLNIPWQRTMGMLYLTSACIIIRNIFRVVEYAAGQSGYAFTHEWCTYVFDGTAMLLVMVIFRVFWPHNTKHQATLEKSPLR